MRKSVDLTAAEKATANTARVLLTPHVGEVVTVDFIKADGTARTITGTLVAIVGAGDKEIAQVETDAGFRSANLYRVTAVS